MHKFSVLVLSAATAFGQALSFDVATIKPSEPFNGGMVRFGSSGGPGTSDPGLFKCSHCTVSMLVLQAWNLRKFELTGPASLDDAGFDISAKVPEGTTKEQFRLMLQNLLADRFRLTVHHETKDLPKYDLVIAKGGSKLKSSQPVEAASGDAVPGPPVTGKMEKDKDGYPVMPAGISGAFMIMNGRARTQSLNQTADQIAAFLANIVGKPVTDATGLKGKYDYILSWGMDMAGVRITGGPGMPPPPPPPPGGGALTADAPEADSGPTIFAAVQEQLGLKLEPKKGPVDVLVVDHVERTPTEN